ncbi:hypothetical protein PRUPE_8G146900 [Prunus persica]|uniref:Uncharacterized protein n=1 Tax=Prunus persica TaxID=3760 RepID=A0A251MY29_PRUPE|nr:hypothetical protein PRUPE_8G146900 [Prunus persica]
MLAFAHRYLCDESRAPEIGRPLRSNVEPLGGSNRSSFHSHTINPIQRLIFRLHKVPVITHVVSTYVRPNAGFLLFKRQPKELLNHIPHTLQNRPRYTVVLDYEHAPSSCQLSGSVLGFEPGPVSWPYLLMVGTPKHHQLKIR